MNKIPIVLRNHLCHIGITRQHDIGTLCAQSMRNYWILNCNPKMFDFENALQNEEILENGMTWKVSQQEEEIERNDVFFLYVGHPYQSIVACGSILEPVSRIECDNVSAQYWQIESKKERNKRILISIDHKFEDYILRKTLNPKGTHPTKTIPLGEQGSNKKVQYTAVSRFLELCKVKFD
jgi:hypothetical protein